MSGARIAVLSLEPWDEVWRRNQHLVSSLIDSGAVERALFVEPPAGGYAAAEYRRDVHPGVVAVRPPLIVPRRIGGHAVLGAWLRRAVRGADLLWVNDPVAGARALRNKIPALYDVTDDWRSMPQRPSDRRRTIEAEDYLAVRASTVVCSEVLAARWRERYGVSPSIVQNGVDVDAIRGAAGVGLPGTGPHLVYVGTVHANRVDIELVASLADLGTVHLVGPCYLDGEDQRRLNSAGVLIHGPVGSSEVPRWLVAADVLICPHRVDEFTLSLDAIKAHEYLATDRPVVATASCGFQTLGSEGLVVTGREDFRVDVHAAIGTGPFVRPAPATWTDRARTFTEVLEKTWHA